MDSSFKSHSVFRSLEGAVSNDRSKAALKAEQERARSLEEVKKRAAPSVGKPLPIFQTPLGAALFVLTWLSMPQRTPMEGKYAASARAVLVPEVQAGRMGELTQRALQYLPSEARDRAASALMEGAWAELLVS